MPLRRLFECGIDPGVSARYPLIVKSTEVGYPIDTAGLEVDPNNLVRSINIREYLPSNRLHFVNHCLSRAPQTFLLLSGSQLGERIRVEKMQRGRAVRRDQPAAVVRQPQPSIAISRACGSNVSISYSKSSLSFHVSERSGRQESSGLRQTPPWKDRDRRHLGPARRVIERDFVQFGAAFESAGTLKQPLAIKLKSLRKTQPASFKSLL